MSVPGTVLSERVYEPEEEHPVTVLITELESVLDEEHDEMEPLFDYVDVDAVRAVIDSSEDSQVTFRYQHLTVRMSQGAVSIHRE